MTLPLRIVVQALAGLAIAASLVFLAAASALVLAFVTAGRVHLPPIVEVWTSLEANGTTALEFIPDFGGAGIVILVLAAVYTTVTVAVGQRRARRV